MRGVGLAAWAALVIACNDRPLPGDASTGAQSTASSSSGDTPTSSSGDTPTTSASDDTAMTPADPTGTPAMCGCGVAPEQASCDDEATLWAFVPECPGALPCERVTVRCPRPGADLYDCQNELVFAEEALDCVLTAMRDRTPGRFVLEGTVSGNHGYHETYGLHLTGGETAVLSTCTGGIVGSIAGAQGTLLAPKFFADCLALENPQLRYACVATGVDQQTSLPACAGG